MKKVKTYKEARLEQENSEYTKQANDFLNKHGITFKAEFIQRIVNPWKDKDYKVPNHYGDGRHAQYRITFSKDGKTDLVIDSFTQSLMNSNLCQRWNELYQEGEMVLALPPSAYCVLAGLTKHDPKTFEDFCAEFGYDDDSIKAKEVFEAVDKEWHRVNRFFTPEQLEELQDIQ